ncbi:NADP-dependent oxidoreductase [Glaciihabitans sp. dw_435]|uniref:NADP-dependent oxidoreductase n=1 Tax=Glaciihabitans sp. dw_435 TaxID=2720081 RepID=UPI001BD4706F|nr:NADP-dependent oxidoreductase [Glaciihabitans sp. dw_435]
MSRVIVQRSFGSPSVLEVAEVAVPPSDELAPGEVLIRVAYAGVNPVDIKTRKGGAVAGLFDGFPVTVGWDLAGTVNAVGSEVTDFAIGDRAFGMSRFPQPGRAYAEHVVADATDLVHTPDAVSDEQAAALPLAGLTVWENLVDLAELQATQRIAIMGAGGGTGHLAVQIAHHLGATVTAVASAGKLDWLRSLGADVTVDYRSDDLVTLFADRPFDVVFNASDTTAGTGIAVTRPGGVVIDISETVTDDDRALAARTGVRVEVPSVTRNRVALQTLADLAARGSLVSHISSTFPLADAAAAHAEIEAGHARGKILLQP